MDSSNIIRIADGVLQSLDDYAVLSNSLKSTLLEECRASTKKRARINFHSGPDDPVQEMIICMSRLSDVALHNHLDKSESFCILDGSLAIILFHHDKPEILDTVFLSSIPEKNLAQFYRLNISLHHLVIPLTEYVFFHEVTTGPFPGGSSEPPPWTLQAYAPQLLAEMKEQVRETYNSI